MAGSTDIWQQELQSAIRSGQQLMRRLKLNETLSLQDEALDFPVLATENFIAKIKPGDAKDPLLLQVMAQPEETSQQGVHDPLEEKNHIAIPGLVRKYKQRALLMSTHACPINCRFCFRRHHQIPAMKSSQRQAIIQWLSEELDIQELIFSGGDPLMLSDNQLEWWIEQLQPLSHITTLRFHSRFISVLPSRLTDKLLAMLVQSGKRIVWVWHINHPAEIDDVMLEKSKAISSAGMHQYHQATLLRGVNDEVAVLAELCEKLFSAGIQPYYLHAFDPVQGANHFSLSDQQSVDLYKKLCSQLSGYITPKLVREVPGEKSKVPLSWF